MKITEHHSIVINTISFNAQSGNWSVSYCLHDAVSGANKTMHYVFNRNSFDGMNATANSVVEKLITILKQIISEGKPIK